MDISILDGTNYFKGLLLLIRKDRKVSDPEVQLMMRIGKTLGFEREFCENAITEILENEHIVDAPPEFSSEGIAKKFIKDGLGIALSDEEYHSAEEEWLLSVARVNGLDPEWFREESSGAAERKHLPVRMEVDDLTLTYS